MCGRAGRPPFDDTGMVIIMTRRETVNYWNFSMWLNLLLWFYFSLMFSACNLLNDYRSIYMRISWMDAKLLSHSKYCPINFFLDLLSYTFFKSYLLASRNILLFILFQIAAMLNRAPNRRNSSTYYLWHYTGNWVDEVLIPVCQNEKSTFICSLNDLLRNLFIIIYGIANLEVCMDRIQRIMLLRKEFLKIE